MLLIKGTRKLRIRTWRHHDRQCDSCKDFDLTVKVYKDYYHVFFIPLFATGIKRSAITCNNCGILIRSDSLSKEYESKTRVPFYLYSGVILVALVALAAFAASGWNQYERSRYIAYPKVGDVYFIKTEASPLDGYNFLRVKRISGDSVITADNNMVYLTSASAFDSVDYFDINREKGYTKAQLKELLSKGAIEDVYRAYDEATGFNRMK
jgi:hypothetical protein